MPCNGDYMNATTYERDLSRVACLLDELDGRSWERRWWNGYHPRVYCRNLDRATGDAMVTQLCDALQNRDAASYSLEMQIWWRDHQVADRERVAQEINASQAAADRAAALSKLTPYEQRLLGVGPSNTGEPGV